MSVVRVNAIAVPHDRADEMVARFETRAGEVSKMPGFEAFELLRPTDGREVFLVYTRWRSDEDFENWVNSEEFQHGHRAHSSQGAVGTTSEVWAFEVVQHEEASPGPPEAAG